MIVIKNRNVNGMLADGLRLLAQDGELSASRAGDVLVMPCPVMSVYVRPTERVLFDAARDANPMFHIMEALWMLAGRSDSAFLDNYVRDFGSRYAEKDGVIHGAYGDRWRKHFGFDQLNEIIERLRDDPTDRQCVLAMWDPTSIGGAADLTETWKDRPCNTHIYFRVRGDRGMRDLGNGNVDDYDDRVLDMTICCRSNDIVWGAYGANAVHFSVLMEYVAGRLGVSVGTMYQFSNNYHGYLSALDRFKNLDAPLSDPYADGSVETQVMGTDWNAWDDDLAAFMRWHGWVGRDTPHHYDYANVWFADVAQHVALANWNWKNGCKPTARRQAEMITSPDWRRAVLEWMDRRLRR